LTLPDPFYRIGTNVPTREKGGLFMKLNKHMSVKGQIKDRGRIKWTAMMLTEHVDMLKEWQEEDRYNSRPALNEFDLEAIFEEIQLAYKRQCDVEIRIW